MGCGAPASICHRYVVTASGDRTARLWDASSGSELVRVDHSDAVVSAHLDVRGPPEKGEWRLVTASADGTARIWRVRARRLPLIMEEAGHEPDRLDINPADTVPRGVEICRVTHGFAHIATAHVDSSGQRLVTAGEDGTARLWSLPDCSEISRATHEDSVLCAQLVEDVDRAELLVTASEDGTARVWADVAQPCASEVLRVEHDATSAAKGITVAKLGGTTKALLVTAGCDGTARIWDRRTGHEMMRVRHESSNPCAVRSVDHCVSGGRGRLLTAADDRTVRVWDADTGQELHRMELGSPICHAEFARIRGKDLQVLTAGSDGAAVLWRIQQAAASGEHRLLVDDWDRVLELRHASSIHSAALYQVSAPW